MSKRVCVSAILMTLAGASLSQVTTGWAFGHEFRNHHEEFAPGAGPERGHRRRPPPHRRRGHFSGFFKGEGAAVRADLVLAPPGPPGEEGFLGAGPDHRPPLPPRNRLRIGRKHYLLRAVERTPVVTEASETGSSPPCRRGPPPDERVKAELVELPAPGPGEAPDTAALADWIEEAPVVGTLEGILRFPRPPARKPPGDTPPREPGTEEAGCACREPGPPPHGDRHPPHGPPPGPVFDGEITGEVQGILLAAPRPPPPRRRGPPHGKRRRGPGDEPDPHRPR